MARIELLVQLAQAAVAGDTAQAARALEAIIAEAHDKDHRLVVERLTRILQQSGTRYRSGRILSGDIAALVHNIVPERQLAQICLSKHNHEVLAELIVENDRCEFLQSNGIAPRNRLMFVGPPGNGKTSLAEALAYELKLPMVVVRYDGLIGSYLGQTASRLNKIFEYVRERHCLLFFDEFDVIGKERGDKHETGEIKRVVSSLLLQVDALPTRTVIVVASNHPHLLDTAAWRRFQVRIELSPPSTDEATAYVNAYQTETNLNFGIDAHKIINDLRPTSYSELEEFCRDVLRKATLDEAKDNAKAITTSKIEQWNRRV